MISPRALHVGVACGECSCVIWAVFATPDRWAHARCVCCGHEGYIDTADTVRVAVDGGAR